MDLYQIIISLFICIIESISELLPISSTGHVIILSHWFKIQNHYTKNLLIFMQLGSTLALYCFFHQKLLKILNIRSTYIQKTKKISHILCAICPTIFLGLICYNQIKTMSNIYTVMYGLIFGGIVLILSEILKPKTYTTYHIHDISLSQSIIIGLFQTVALFPGISRSGMTISGGMLSGIKKSVAIDFSFIISIPLLLGVSLFDLIKNFNIIRIVDLPICFMVCIIAFIISFVSMKKLFIILKNTSMVYFGIYRFSLALGIYLNA